MNDKNANINYFDEHSEALTSRISAGLQKVGLALKQHTWQVANKEGLSPTQGKILSLIHGNGAMTGTELSQKLGVTLPTISASVRVLVEKNLLIKTPDSRHPRASLLRLTPTGEQVARGADAWPEFLTQAVSAMDAQEQSAFLSGITKMIFILQEDGKLPPSEICVTCTYFRPWKHRGAKPHHCAFVDAPMANDQLRLDCGDHELASPNEVHRTWEHFSK